MKNIFIALFIVCISVACKETKFVDDANTELDLNEAQMSFKNITTLYSEDTDIMFKLMAPTQYRYQDGNERFPDGLNIEMFTEEGKKKSTLVADSGVYLFEERLYRVMGNVVVVDLLEGKTLESDLLNWQKDSSIVYTDTHVKIVDGGQTLEGEGLRAKQDFSEYEILEVTGVY